MFGNVDAGVIVGVVVDRVATVVVVSDGRGVGVGGDVVDDGNVVGGTVVVDGGVVDSGDDGRLVGAFGGLRVVGGDAVVGGGVDVFIDVFVDSGFHVRDVLLIIVC